MNYWYFIGGLLVLLFVLIDLVRTTLSMGGDGWFTGRMARALHGLLLKTRKNSSRSLLQHAGTVIMVLGFLFWALGLWTGWTLVFLSEPSAVVNTSTGEPADFWSRVYVAGFGFITLGVGDYSPGSPLYQVAIVVSALTGFFVVSLSVTYASGMLQVVAEKRQVGGSVSSLGMTGTEVLLNSWNGRNFGQLDAHLISLGPNVVLSDRHLFAYPVAHLYPTDNPAMSFPIGIATLYDTLVLLEQGVAKEARPDKTVTQPLRRTIESLGRSVSGHFGDKSDEKPPPLSLQQLRKAGIPCAEDGSFAQDQEAAQEHRARINGMVKREGMDWPIQQ